MNSLKSCDFKTRATFQSKNLWNNLKNTPQTSDKEDRSSLNSLISLEYSNYHQRFECPYFLNETRVQTIQSHFRCCAQVSQESWEILYLKDLKGAETRYKYLFHNEINSLAKHRYKLLDWIADICSIYKFHRETYHLAMAYFDHYIFLSATNSVPQNELQLIGLASLLIATKVEEIKSLPIEDILYLSDGAYTMDQVLQSEKSITEAMEWKCYPTTANMWLLRFLHNIERKIKVKEFKLCTMLLDVATLDVYALKFPNCVIAASCIKLVLSEKVLKDVSKLNLLGNLNECSKWLKAYWQEIRLTTNLSEKDDTLYHLPVSECCPRFPYFSLIQECSSKLEIFDKVKRPYIFL